MCVSLSGAFGRLGRATTSPRASCLRADHHDTLRALASLHRHILAAHKRAAARSGTPAALPTWDEFRAARREAGAGSQTLRDAWVLMLASLRGAGHGAVSAVSHAFPTPRAMHAALRAQPREQAVRLLRASVPPEGGRAVGPALAAYLLDVLFPARALLAVETAARAET